MDSAWPVLEYMNYKWLYSEVSLSQIYFTYIFHGYQHPCSGNTFTQFLWGNLYYILFLVFWTTIYPTLPQNPYHNIYQRNKHAKYWHSLYREKINAILLFIKLDKTMYAWFPQIESNNLKCTDWHVTIALIFLSQIELCSFSPAPLIMLSQFSPHFHHSRPNSDIVVLSMPFWIPTSSPQPSSPAHETSSFWYMKYNREHQLKVSYTMHRYQQMKIDELLRGSITITGKRSETSLPSSFIEWIW